MKELIKVELDLNKDWMDAKNLYDFLGVKKSFMEWLREGMNNLPVNPETNIDVWHEFNEYWECSLPGFPETFWLTMQGALGMIPKDAKDAKGAKAEEARKYIQSLIRRERERQKKVELIYEEMASWLVHFVPEKVHEKTTGRTLDETFKYVAQRIHWKLSPLSYPRKVKGGYDPDKEEQDKDESTVQPRLKQTFGTVNPSSLCPMGGRMGFDYESIDGCDDCLDTRWEACKAIAAKLGNETAIDTLKLENELLENAMKIVERRAQEDAQDAV